VPLPVPAGGTQPPIRTSGGQASCGISFIVLLLLAPTVQVIE
jgi:hypothetical protein